MKKSNEILIECIFSKKKNPKKMHSRMEHQKNVGFPLHDWGNLISIRTFSLDLLANMSQEFKEECLKEYEEGLVFDSLTFKSLDDYFPFIILYSG